MGLLLFHSPGPGWAGGEEDRVMGTRDVGTDLPPNDHAGRQDLSLQAGPESSLSLHTGVFALPR